MFTIGPTSLIRYDCSKHNVRLCLSHFQEWGGTSQSLSFFISQLRQRDSYIEAIDNKIVQPRQEISASTLEDYFCSRSWCVVGLSFFESEAYWRFSNFRDISINVTNLFSKEGSWGAIARNRFTIAFFCMPKFRDYSVTFHLHIVTWFLSRLSCDCSVGTSYHIGTYPFLGQVRSDTS